MISIQTEKPIAYDSPDHIFPFGTANDNSTDHIFNESLFSLIPRRDVRLLDIGCAGGGFVKSIIEAGGFAVGVEGSDYSQKRRRAEWATIPNNLFTADATAPFQLSEDGEPLKFNVITAWEFMEHISEETLGGVLDNIRRHLAPQGILIVSVCPLPCLHNGERDGEGVALHLTVRPEAWWKQRFSDAGFLLFDDLKSRFTHYVRGFPHEPDSSVLICAHPSIKAIPKIFHQVWLGGQPFPAEAQRLQDGWRAKHSDWDWRIWTDADFDSLECQPLLDHAAHLSQKSDILRYEILRRHGGVYLDTDMECLQGIEPLLAGTTAFAGRQTDSALCGAILGGVAGHPLFHALVQNLPDAMRTETQCTFQAGPNYLTRIAAETPGVTLFSSETFYPYLWDQAIPADATLPNSYAIHHWAGTWHGTESITPSRLTDTLTVNGLSVTAYPIGRHAAFTHTPAQVTVCIPVGGPGTHLARAIESALLATEDTPQVIVVATPMTFGIACDFADQTESVLACCVPEQTGYIESLNLCLELAPGEYLTILLGTDALRPGALSKLAQTLDNYPQTIVCRAATETVSRAGHRPDAPFAFSLQLPPESAVVYNMTQADAIGSLAGLLFRRSALEHTGLRFDPELAHAAAFDFTLNLLLEGDFAYQNTVGAVCEGRPDYLTLIPSDLRQFRAFALARVEIARQYASAFTADELRAVAELISADCRRRKDALLKQSGPTPWMGELLFGRADALRAYDHVLEEALSGLLELLNERRFESMGELQNAA